jgi:hypothetical protein
LLSRDFRHSTPTDFSTSGPVIGAGVLLSRARQGGRSTRGIRIRQSLLSLTAINVLTEERWENPLTSSLNVKEWCHKKSLAAMILVASFLDTATVSAEQGIVGYGLSQFDILKTLSRHHL